MRSPLPRVLFAAGVVACVVSHCRAAEQHAPPERDAAEASPPRAVPDLLGTIDALRFECPWAPSQFDAEACTLRLPPCGRHEGMIPLALPLLTLATEPGPAVVFRCREPDPCIPRESVTYTLDLPHQLSRALFLAPELRVRLRGDEASGQAFVLAIDELRAQCAPPIAGRKIE